MLEQEVLGAYGENAFAILGIVSSPLRRQDPEAAERFYAEATSGDYENLNKVARKWARGLDNDDIDSL